ncbi:MAG: 50S ribosomal protein L37e [Nanoarchaeota archaeon]|nr:50S ribosomal protein L37e [Nanoarchaeota archaeon]MBU4124114.1 50S ribosomal protein L37e [Nanoarchaeota archaeon]
MSKGTPSFGKHNKTSHIPCRRCGIHAYHVKHKRCAHCGYPDSKIYKFRWNWKNILTRNRKK